MSDKSEKLVESGLGGVFQQCRDPVCSEGSVTENGDPGG